MLIALRPRRHAHDRDLTIIDDANLRMTIAVLWIGWLVYWMVAAQYVKPRAGENRAHPSCSIACRFFSPRVCWQCQTSCRCS
jgi:hypothetical protein